MSIHNPSTDGEVKMHACFVGEKLTDASVFQPNKVLMLYDDESSEDGEGYSDNEALDMSIKECSPYLKANSVDWYQEHSSIPMTGMMGQ